MKPNSSFNFVIALVLTVIIFAFDEKVATDVLHQHEAVSFPTTTGKVYHSAVTVTHSSKGGTSYHINILYDYEVDGQSFQGSTFRHDLMGPPSGQAYAAVRAHPAGSEITVYYRADDPSDSLLSPGIVGHDLLIFFILLPASALPLQLLAKSNAPAWFKPGNPPAGGVPVLSQGNQIRARLPRYSVLAWTVVTFCGTSIVSFFVLLLTTARNPSVEPELTAWALISIVTAAVFWWRRARLLSGVDDLVIDESARTVSLPQTFGRNRCFALPFNAVESVYLEQVAHRGKYGYYYSWAVTLDIQNGSASTERLSDWYDEEKARAFAAWLRERLHLPGVPGADVVSSSAFSLSSSVG
jgi:Protein of unknown function (DUF3592)